MIPIFIIYLGSGAQEDGIYPYALEPYFRHLISLFRTPSESVAYLRGVKQGNGNYLVKIITRNKVQNSKGRKAFNVLIRLIGVPQFVYSGNTI